MDINNQNKEPEQTDLSNQYNDILEKYSQQLATANQEQPPEPVAEIPPPLAPPEPVTNPPTETPLRLEPTPTPTPAMPTAPTYEPVFTPPSDDPVPILPPKQSNFFKILFFISLFIFLGVAGGIVYTLFFQPKPEVSLILDVTPTENPAPTVPTGPVCSLNDKTYPVGETFSATDGCNTCTCGEDLMITCTEKACPSVVPTKTTSTKTYQDPKGKYSFSYPTGYKLLTSVPSSFDGTMLDKAGNTCGGPILQNIADPKILIVISPDLENGGGGFCWSNGVFSLDNKWSVSESVGWKGSYFIQKTIPIGTIGLANKETYSLKGEADLDQIVTSFKVIN